MRIIRPAIALAMMLAAASASAQPSAPGTVRFVSVNGGLQIGTTVFSDGFVKHENEEDGRLEGRYVVDSGPSFSVSGGAMLGRRLGIGVGLTRFSRSTVTTLNGSIPHPFFFNRPRSLTADVVGLRREELTLHVRATGVVWVGRRTEVNVFGGPAVFFVKQDLLADFTFTDEYPYDSASFDEATSDVVRGTAIGFSLGGDTAFFLSPRVGVGVTVLYSRATVGLRSPGGDSVNGKAGGTQVGGGLRLRF